MIFFFPCLHFRDGSVISGKCSLGFLLTKETWITVHVGKKALGNTKGQDPNCTFIYKAATVPWELCKRYI